MEVIKAIKIFSDVDAVKDTNKPLLKESNKKYVSLEDVREFVFNLDHELKRRIQEGKSRVGWCSVDIKFMTEFINEVIQPTYEKLQEEA